MCVCGGRVCVCVCVCVETARARARARVSVCVWCVCVCARERACRRLRECEGVVFQCVSVSLCFV